MQAVLFRSKEIVHFCFFLLFSFLFGYRDKFFSYLGPGVLILEHELGAWVANGHFGLLPV